MKQAVDPPTRAISKPRSPSFGSRWNWLVTALVVFPAMATLQVPVGGSDEATLLVYPEKMTKGEMPHLDFFSPYGPGTYRILQWAYAMAGSTITVERSVGILYHVAIALGVMQLVKRLGLRSSIVAGLMCCSLFWWFFPYAYAWMGGLALVTWSLALTANGRRDWVIALGGALGGLAAFWRPEMGLLLLATIPLLLKTRRYVPYIAGLALGLVPLAMHLTATGLSAFESVVRSRAAVNAQTSFDSVGVPVWLLLALCLLGIFAMLRAAFRLSEHRFVLLSCATASALMMPQALQRIDFYHAIFAACFILPIASGIVAAEPAESPKPIPAAVRRTMSAVGAAAIGVLLAGSLAISQIPKVDVENLGRSLPLSPDQGHQMQRVVEALTRHAPPGSSVFMGAEDMSRPGRAFTELYYLLLQYQSDFFYLELAPGAAERPGSPLLQDVMSADVLVLESVPSSVITTEFPYIRQGSTAVNEAVAQHFILVESIGSTSVFLRK